MTQITKNMPKRKLQYAYSECHNPVFNPIQIGPRGGISQAETKKYSMNDAPLHLTYKIPIGCAVVASHEISGKEDPIKISTYHPTPKAMRVAKSVAAWRSWRYNIDGFWLEEADITSYGRKNLLGLTAGSRTIDSIFNQK
jgi:hypothetical protein